MQRLKSIAIACLGLGFLAFAFWFALLRVTNEIGPIGADKDGRQILIQSLDAMFKSLPPDTPFRLSVESEFHDVPLPMRLLQEPMRTTLKLSYKMGPKANGSPDANLFRQRFLTGSAADFVGALNGPTNVRRDDTLSPAELKAALADLKVNTMAQFFAAFGFRRVQVLFDGAVVLDEPLPELSRHNITVLGGS